MDATWLLHGNSYKNVKPAMPGNTDRNRLLIPHTKAARQTANRPGAWRTMCHERTHRIDQSATGGDHAATWLQDQFKAGRCDQVADRVNEVLWRRQLVAPAQSHAASFG